MDVGAQRLRCRSQDDADVVAAVNFARENKLRLVVKGGGHSYQGTSDAADSLLVWTRAMNNVVLHDAFVAAGMRQTAPQPAVTVEAGAYGCIPTTPSPQRRGRYVQGGGCATVGVAGLIQSGGFGSFSKNYGTAAGGLLEAEIVTADGQVRIANACTNSDLFWGIKGGGGGSFGVVTRLTLRTRELPAFFGGVDLKVTATSDAAFRDSSADSSVTTAESLLNRTGGRASPSGPTRRSRSRWPSRGWNPSRPKSGLEPVPRLDPASPRGFHRHRPLHIRGGPGRNHWNAAFLKRTGPTGRFSISGRARRRTMFGSPNRTTSSGYSPRLRVAWLPASLLQKNRQKRFVDALFAATRH